MFATDLLSQDFKTIVSYLIEHLKTLRASGAIIQAQPVGMMRLALGQQENAADGLFMHVWRPGLPMQATGGPFAHTHVFDLTSRVLKGYIRNVLYQPQANPLGTHKLITAICEQDNCSLEQSRIIDTVDMVVTHTEDVYPGESYDVPKHVFHESLIQPDGVVVTIMQKKNVEYVSPVAAIPIELPINPKSFDRNQLSQTEAWQEVMEIVEGIV